MLDGLLKTVFQPAALPDPTSFVASYDAKSKSNGLHTACVPFCDVVISQEFYAALRTVVSRGVSLQDHETLFIRRNADCVVPVKGVVVVWAKGDDVLFSVGSPNHSLALTWAPWAL